ncbi:hypothetical protein MBLNU230_g5479t1 [Neophaeotheca triangularis]
MIRQPPSLAKDISPPPSRKTTTGPISGPKASNNASPPETAPHAADIEAGQVQITDHLMFFANRHKACSRFTATGIPRISIKDFSELYQRNSHQNGRHFVVTQHDHPVSGVHYDLRLQFSDSSSISFAVPYGLPGNPNSLRPNRLAIETRVHCIWNNLIESASHAIGSLLIWDTGEYEIVEKQAEEPVTEDEHSDDETRQTMHSMTESQKLFAAFQTRHIKLRLHGSKLPAGYTVSLRLPSANNRDSQQQRPKRKRRGLDPKSRRKPSEPSQLETDSESETVLARAKAGTAVDEAVDTTAVAAAEASGGEDENASIRANNAYAGAENSIGSTHQRHWFLTLDRQLSGFRKVRTGPERGQWQGPWEAFFVLGRDCERSVVTGRSADEVMEDDGVNNFKGRKMWRAIVE